MRTLAYQNRYRAKNVALFTLLATAVLGIFNILINREAISSQFGERTANVLILIPGVIFVSAGLYIFYVIVVGLALYFATAALNSGLDVKKSFAASIRILLPLPLLTLSDTVGFLVAGRKLISMGLLGKLSYLPFYVLFFLSALVVLPRYTDLNAAKTRTLALILLAAIFLVSFPFGGELF